LTSPIYRITDCSLPGCHPLRTHILICGFGRSGTTLLLAMLEYALPHARYFGREVRGWRAANYSWRNHALMISKFPADILVLDKLQKLYEKRRADLKTILMVRDPRDILTSHHVYADIPYFMSPERWRGRYKHFVIHRDQPDVLVLKYEQIVQDLVKTQNQIEAFIGEKLVRPLAEFYTQDRQEFDQRPLNGWRPVDAQGVGRWARPEHAARIRQMLQEMPELPAALIDLGYETDDSWTKSFDHGISLPVKESSP
jgi:hypothetical protein